MDLINTLRIILEQSAEWQSPLYALFIDYQKAFDSIKREAMWRALQAYGVPEKILRLIQEMYSGYTCQVIHDGVLSSPLPVTAGVRQGCVLSPTLFLLVLDLLMRKTLGGRKRGIQWNFLERLEDLDYADDVCMLAQRLSDMSFKLDKLKEYSAMTGLRINVNKTKEMRMNVSTRENLEIDGNRIERVDSFQYLGSNVDTSGGAEEDIGSRIRKANGAFVQLYPVWKNRNLSLSTKLRLFNTNVKSVLLYACETWKVTRTLTRKLQVFVNRCLRRILGVWWPDVISNDELLEKTQQKPISVEIKRRKWRWIGHTLRKDESAIERKALDWNPQGHRRRGRPRMTWRRSIETEASGTGKSWQEIKVLSRNRDGWRSFVEALCSS